MATLIGNFFKPIMPFQVSDQHHPENAASSAQPSHSPQNGMSPQLIEELQTIILKNESSSFGENEVISTPIPHDLKRRFMLLIHGHMGVNLHSKGEDPLAHIKTDQKFVSLAMTNIWKSLSLLSLANSSRKTLAIYPFNTGVEGIDINNFVDTAVETLNGFIPEKSDLVIKLYGENKAWDLALTKLDQTRVKHFQVTSGSITETDADIILCSLGGQSLNLSLENFTKAGRTAKAIFSLLDRNITAAKANVPLGILSPEHFNENLKIFSENRLSRYQDNIILKQALRNAQHRGPLTFVLRGKKILLLNNSFEINTKRDIVIQNNPNTCINRFFELLASDQVINPEDPFRQIDFYKSRSRLIEQEALQQVPELKNQADIHKIILGYHGNAEQLVPLTQNMYIHLQKGLNLFYQNFYTPAPRQIKDLHNEQAASYIRLILKSICDEFDYEPILNSSGATEHSRNDDLSVTLHCSMKEVYDALENIRVYQKSFNKKFAEFNACVRNGNSLKLSLRGFSNLLIGNGDERKLAAFEFVDFCQAVIPIVKDNW